MKCLSVVRTGQESIGIVGVSSPPDPLLQSGIEALVGLEGHEISSGEMLCQLCARVKRASAFWWFHRLLTHYYILVLKH